MLSSYSTQAINYRNSDQKSYIVCKINPGCLLFHTPKGPPRDTTFFRDAKLEQQGKSFATFGNDA
jgi:hypothetical protein